MSRPSRIVIHIGIYKTGTSSIQAFLHSNHQRLLEMGILYPYAGRWREGSGLEKSHFPLAASLMSQYAPRFGVNVSSEPWDHLRAEMAEKGSRVVVLSSELLWYATEEEVGLLREHLAPWPVRIVVYVRNPLDFVVSSYKQRVKTGTYSGTLEASSREAIQSGILDYERSVRRWESFFGRPEVDVRIYEKVRNRLLEDFAEAAGLGSFPPGFGGYRVNISPSDGVVQFLRWVNRLEGTESKSPRRSLRRRARRAVVQRRGAGRGLARMAEIVFPRPLVEEDFTNRFREATREMRERFCQRLDPDDRQYFQF